MRENEEDAKNELSLSIYDYFHSDIFTKIIKKAGFGDDAQNQITNKCDEYITKFDKNEIDKNKLKTKLLNYFKDIKGNNKTEKNTKNIEKIDEIRKEIKDIYKSSENSGTKMFDDISKIEDNDNDKSDLDIPKLDLSYMEHDEELNNTFGNENFGNVLEQQHKTTDNNEGNNIVNEEKEKMNENEDENIDNSNNFFQYNF